MQTETVPASKPARPLKRRAQSDGLSANEMLERFEYLAIDETCEVMRVGRTTLHRLFKAKSLTPLKLGGRTVVRSQEIRSFLDNLPVAAHA